MTVRFITYYCRLNQSLLIKTYPLPRIGDTVQQLEGLQYATSLDLNMVYYIIRLYPASRYMTMIVTESGKFRYNRLSMGMCASGDIIQAKVDELIDNIKGAKIYIDNLLVLRKDSFEKQIEQLRIIVVRLRGAGLNVNAHK